MPQAGFGGQPSSCSTDFIKSEPWNLQVVPVNAAPPTINFLQDKRVWEEDSTVPLRVSVGFPDRPNDSGLAAFAYIEVEDLNIKNQNLDKNNGGGADFFSYGWSRGASTTGAYSDAISSTPGITRVNAHTWRSYSNDCWRKVFEAGTALEGGIVGLDMANVDYGSSDLNTNTIEQCLRHSRQEGELIWGQDPTWKDDQNRHHKVGLHVRPKRKQTKNNKFKVTVYMIDGDIHNWHSTVQTTSASKEIEILWTPRTTRYNQKEVYSMQQLSVTENAIKSLQFNDDASQIGYPRSYRENAQVCTCEWWCVGGTR